MAGYVIHLAVGKVYLKNYKIKDLESFEKGIIAPDIANNKAKSHYGKVSSQPGLSKFVQTNGIKSSFDEGYFLHLVTDYLFYNKFLDRWNVSIYKDYDILNKKLMQIYNVNIPKEIKEYVKFADGDLSILKEDKVCRFIDSVGRINIIQIALGKNTEYELLKER